MPFELFECLYVEMYTDALLYNRYADKLKLETRFNFVGNHLKATFNNYA